MMAKRLAMNAVPRWQYGDFGLAYHWHGKTLDGAIPLSQYGCSLPQQNIGHFVREKMRQYEAVVCHRPADVMSCKFF
ncbi:hypothetical protein NPIL_17961 [Nephila pilipes]|uniref:Uncharacterized protein n=1 Tax=Nephila pilipes TaxID=299642 RepID=A0A8X6MYH8_NEPPI|nr:hypothetical protein NPIL_17961 [Nephila pilipes]